mgnify:CR=1 FL=1
MIVASFIALMLWFFYYTAGHLLLRYLNPERFNEANLIMLDKTILIFIYSVIFYLVIFKFFKFLLSKNKDYDFARRKTKHVSFKFNALITIIIYCVCTLLFFYPFIRTLSSFLIGPPEDNLQGLWNIWWGYEVFSNNDLNFAYTKYLFFPEGNSLLYHDFSLLNYFISIPLKPLANLVLIYNLLILISFPLAGLSMYLLIRYLTKNSFAGIIGGFIFAFSPYHIAHSLHHLNLSTIYFIPLFILFFIKSIRNKDNKKLNIFLASLLFILCAISHWNYFIFNLFFILFSFVYLVFKNKKSKSIFKIIYKIIIITGAAIIILSPLITSMLIVGWNNPDIQANVGGHNEHVADLMAYILPHSNHLFSNTDFVNNIRTDFTGNSWETSVYLGIPILLLIAVFFKRIIKQTAVYFGGLIIFLLLSSGTYLHFQGIELPIVLPYYLIQKIPFLASARIPARNIIFVYIFLAIIIGFIINYLFIKIKNKRLFALCLSIIFMIIFIDYYAVLKQKTNVFLPDCYSKLEKYSDEFGIINFPLDDQNFPFNYDTRYMLHQTYHEIPIANGYISRKIGSTFIDKVDMKNISNQKKQLVDNKLRYIVVHKNFPTSKYLDIAEYKKHYQLICNDSENMVFEVK